MKKRYIQYLLFGSGILLCSYAICVMLITMSDFGAMICMLCGVPLIAWAIFYKKIVKLYRYPRLRMLRNIIITGYAVLFIYIAAMSALITFTQKSMSSLSNVDAIIVLGGALDGEKPSAMLAQRLDVAYECYTNNPEAIIIVSGGQGSDEIIPEALSMYHYLIEKGVPEANLIQEDQAKNTIENFEYSKVILDEKFNNPEETYTFVFATSDYHTYRASLIAQDCGIEAIGIGSKTKLMLRPTSYIRESFSLGFYLVTHTF